MSRLLTGTINLVYLSLYRIKLCHVETLLMRMASEVVRSFAEKHNAFWHFLPESRSIVENDDVMEGFEGKLQSRG